MNYPFLLTDSQWDEVSAYFEPKKRKRKVALQVIVSALIYVLKTGCQWRLLPAAYGRGPLVYYYFRKWMAFGVLEDMLYKLVRKIRIQQGRNAEPTAAVIDTQSIKNASGVSEQTGYDGGKKVKGRKRSLATDTQGNALAVGVSAASAHDKGAVLSVRQQVEDYRSIATIFADGAFKGTAPFDRSGKIKWKIVNKKAGSFKVLPKRWVVERTFGWFTNFRRLAKDYEKRVECAKAIILLACIFITVNKLIT
ncbi:MAG: IS5 family transposase [Flavisolibacter sp.]|nr:IS5 family transposase [Flavisolibacter sp.]